MVKHSTSLECLVCPRDSKAVRRHVHHVQAVVQLVDKRRIDLFLYALGYLYDQAILSNAWALV
jgi:hypothetical protein